MPPAGKIITTPSSFRWFVACLRVSRLVARAVSVSAKSIGEDIVTTSVQAVIDGINRIMLKKMLKEKQIN